MHFLTLPQGKKSSEDKWAWISEPVFCTYKTFSLFYILFVTNAQKQNTLLLHYFHMKILKSGPLDFMWSIHSHVEYMQNTKSFITQTEVSLPVQQSTYGHA